MNISRFLLIAILTMFASCSDLQNEDVHAGMTPPKQKTIITEPENTPPEAAEMTEPDQYTMISDNTGEQKVVVLTDKIIREGEISMEVEDYKEAKEAIKKAVIRRGGYISSEDEANNNYQISNDLLVKVKAENFDSLIHDIAGLAVRTDYQKLHSLDAGEEYFDIQTRLKTKRAVEKRYLEFLKQAKNIKEVLMIEDKLRVIREEIEAKEGRLLYLQNRMTLSSLHLHIYQTLDYTYQPTEDPSFFQRILKAMHFGWKGLLAFVIGLAYLWPFILMLFICIIFLKKYMRKRKQRKNQ